MWLAGCAGHVAEGRSDLWRRVGSVEWRRDGRHLARLGWAAHNTAPFVQWGVEVEMARVLMNLVKVRATLAGRTIFDEVSLEVQAGQRVGLVGPNGAGKSTLMRLMAGELPAESGEIFRAAGLTWGRLPQEPAMAPGRTVLQEALAADARLAALEQELDEVEARMADPAVYGDAGRLDKALARQGRLLDEYERLGGPRYESRVKAMLTALGLGEAMWATPVAVLSGGQKKLILLARLLVQEPALLLLDEPDNHLDIAAKENLERIISSYPGGVLIISHDRYLLDGMATHIAELENGGLTLYHGNYSAYTAERELRRLRQQQLYAAQQKEIARIEAAIARFEQWASIVVDERHIRQARSRRKMLERMDKVDAVVEQRRMRLDLEGWRGSKKALELVDLYKTLPDGRRLWKGISLTLWHGERVGFVGPNGAGKSMLLREIVNDDGDSGAIRIGPSTRIGYYSQEHETLDPTQTPLAALRNTVPMSEGGAVAYLGRFLFNYEQVRGAIADLSGGERSRLQLALLVATRPNLLLLDEPTNNLDIASIEVLEGALEEFEGTVLVVSHDRYFLDQVVDDIVELREGRLTEYAGGYTDYLAEAAPG
jgi:ATP-binding cassette, subfamily F, member 3